MTGDHNTTANVLHDTSDVNTTTPTSSLITSNTASTTKVTILSSMTSSEVFALSAGIAFVLVVCLVVVICLRRRGKLKCFQRKNQSRRSSTSSSQHPLDFDPDQDNDDSLRPTDGDLFAIGDFEDGDLTTTNVEDGYFYDEVFNSSAFEDVATNQSIKQLFSVKSDDEVPVLSGSHN